CAVHGECSLHKRAHGLQACTGCEDYVPPAPKFSGSVVWAVGMTSAPRPNPTLHQCARSAVNAGFSPTVYAEPGTDVENLPCPAVVRSELHGAWQNWRQVLRDLLDGNPDANAICTLQDDIVFCRNVRALAETYLFPDDCGVLSLYSPDHEWKYGKYEDDGGCLPVHAAHFIGGCAYVFPRHVA